MPGWRLAIVQLLLGPFHALPLGEASSLSRPHVLDTRVVRLGVARGGFVVGLTAFLLRPNRLNRRLVVIDARAADADLPLAFKDNLGRDHLVTIAAVLVLTGGCAACANALSNAVRRGAARLLLVGLCFMARAPPAVNRYAPCGELALTSAEEMSQSR